jgi:hypothetical protein
MSGWMSRPKDGRLRLWAPRGVKEAKCNTPTPYVTAQAGRLQDVGSKLVELVAKLAVLVVHTRQKTRVPRPRPLFLCHLQLLQGTAIVPMRAS